MQQESRRQLLHEVPTAGEHAAAAFSNTSLLLPACWLPAVMVFL
jgi:hypothetical protein